MSRHEFTQNGYRITVGWDNPLQTFFGQVRSRRGRWHLWVGTSHREVGSVDALAAALRPYGELSGPMMITLRQDHIDCLDRGPTALQRTLPRVIRNAGGSGRI